MKFNNFWNNL